jgi:hypothetical protein
MSGRHQPVEGADSPPRLTCPVCGRPGGLVLLDGKPCMDCIVARHRAAVTKRCSCRVLDRQPRTVTTPVRTWTSCDRCLGTISTSR